MYYWYLAEFEPFLSHTDRPRQETRIYASFGLMAGSAAGAGCTAEQAVSGRLAKRLRSSETVVEPGVPGLVPGLTKFPASVLVRGEEETIVPGWVINIRCVCVLVC